MILKNGETDWFGVGKGIKGKFPVYSSWNMKMKDLQSMESKTEDSICEYFNKCISYSKK